MQRILQYINEWCKLWRLKVNCDKDKTEIIVIRPRTADTPPPAQVMFLGATEVSYADSSKVLGIYLDENLDFKQQAAYTLKRCWFSWSELTAGTTRTAGLNSTVLALLFKAVVLTKLLYAAPMWLDRRLDSFKDLVARAKLKILGSQYHVSRILSGLLTTLPPLEVTLEILTVKFVLKGLSSKDWMTAKLLQIDTEPYHRFSTHISMTRRYLEWKSTLNDEDLGAVGSHPTPRRRSFLRTFDLLTHNSEEMMYTKEEMERYMCKLWDDVVRCSMETLKKKDQFAIELLHTTDDLLALVNTESVLACPLLYRSLDRGTSSTTLNFIHGHNLLFQDFTFSLLDYDRAITLPVCLECGLLPDSPYHKLFECVSVGAVSALRQELLPISEYEVNFHIPLIFSSDSNTG